MLKLVTFYPGCQHDVVCQPSTLLEVLVILSLYTGEVAALKKLKMEKEKEGFPITSLREINTLLKAQHPNIVTVQV